MNRTNIVDVLIVGAGPAGTTLAIDLARRGLEVRIVEKSNSSFLGSRAKGVQPRTLEIFYDLDVIEDIIEEGGLYPKMGIHLGPLTIPKTMIRNIDPTPDIPYPNTILIPQFKVDSALHKKLREHQVDIEFGKTLIDFSQSPEGVLAKVSTDSKVEEIKARFLVGADGGSSSVRKRLGIDFVGSTDEQDRILIVDANVSGLSRNRWHIWPKLRGRFIGACPLPHSNLFQWMIRLSPEEEPPSDLANISKRIQSQIRDSRVKLHDIQWKSVFRPNIRLATHYRQGRVFIAGDAAHVHTPAGAQGLNTGIQDAYNLGWKIAQVLAGAEDSLLDSYEAERLPIAAGVLGLSTQKYQAIGKLDRSSLKRGKDERQLALTYAGSPLISQTSAVTKTLRAGDRAPNACLISSDGRHLGLFEELRGPQFTAIAYGAKAAEELSHLKWPSNGATLNRIIIDKGDMGSCSGLKDLNENFRRAYGILDDALILIRPDKYIAHIANKDSLLSMHAAIAKVTGIN